MRKSKRMSSWLSRSLGVGIAACALVAAMASVKVAKVSADQGNPQVLGMVFDGHSVSNLENSIKFYEILGFKVVQKPSGFKVDKNLNKLEGLPAGTQSRTAILEVQSSVSQTPWPLYLHEYKGIPQKNYSDLDSGALGAGHMDLTVMDDCNIVMNKEKAAGMLKVPDIPMMRNGGGMAPNGTRRFAFIQDPDGWYIELFALATPAPGVRPDAGKLSNSSATMANMNRLGYQMGFNHIGLNVSDAKVERAFYDGTLGGDYPPITPPGTSGLRGMVMLNGWFPQAPTDGMVRLEILGAAANEGKPIPDQKLSDINVNYVAFQVKNIDQVYEAAKKDGATTVSDGGIMKVKGGRAVMMKDPNGVGYVELWEPKK
jgi:catechol 2,3-dioxygenase-like lactoylglutathione lyase family enzyme